jgi:hypothetical protein
MKGLARYVSPFKKPEVNEVFFGRQNIWTVEEMYSNKNMMEVNEHSAHPC